MNDLAQKSTFLRRKQDFPVLVVSQDYELFFHKSGSVAKCLLEPTVLLLDFARKHGMKITFFVDAGMLVAMERVADSSPKIAAQLTEIRKNLESVHSAGHEIALHIHPHWEDAKLVDDEWDFRDTRYQLRDFSADEVQQIVTTYTAVLNKLCDGSVTSFRAGGFCVEPFSVLGPALLKNGISIDSSVVPGAVLNDDEKGFDFRDAPDSLWWRFNSSPVSLDRDGEFLEIPISPLTLPVWHYWGRGLDRVLGRQPAGVLGDGLSKSPGRWEVFLRLAGLRRVSELSIDFAKSAALVDQRMTGNRQEFWQVMGHPKLLGNISLLRLEEFISRTKIRRFETVSGLACAIRANELEETDELERNNGTK
jgi:hypothetical protein